MMCDVKVGKFVVVVVELFDCILCDQEDLVGIYKCLSFVCVEIRIFVDNIVGEIYVGVKGFVGVFYFKDFV